MRIVNCSACADLLCFPCRAFVRRQRRHGARVRSISSRGPDISSAGIATRITTGSPNSRRQTGCKVNVKTAGTSDEMVALMNEGGFDLVTASGDASLRLVAGKRVQEIDPALIPSWKTVDERLQNAPWHTVDGKHYGVPYQWGPNVLMYNTERLQGRAEELERRVRGADPARRQVEQGADPGL